MVVSSSQCIQIQLTSFLLLCTGDAAAAAARLIEYTRKWSSRRPNVFNLPQDMAQHSSLLAHPLLVISYKIFDFATNYRV